jgi:hypothetical protein
MFVMPLLNKASSKVGKEEQRERTQVQPRSTQTQSGSQRGKWKNYVPELSSVARGIRKPEKNSKPGRSVQISGMGGAALS